MVRRNGAESERERWKRRRSWRERERERVRKQERVCKEGMERPAERDMLIYMR
jgi:hypothetical protein